LQKIDAAPVASDHQLAIGPLGILVSAGQKFDGKLFEHGVIEMLQVLIGKCAWDGAWFGDVLDEKFFSEVGECLTKFRSSSLILWAGCGK
jgi:hypothetical protein